MQVAGEDFKRLALHPAQVASPGFDERTSVDARKVEVGVRRLDVRSGKDRFAFLSRVAGEAKAQRVAI